MSKTEALAIMQRDQLVAQWDQDCQNGAKVDSFIVFPSMLDLQKRAKDQATASVKELQGHINDAYVYEHHDGKKELWVRATDKRTKLGSFDYVRCWNSFAKMHGVEDPSSIGSDWQVDHVYPESSASRRELHLVRVMPVPRKGNAGVGASFEALLAKYLPGEHKGGWVASWYTIAKVTGFQGTFNKILISDTDLANQLINHLIALYPDLGIWRQATVNDERQRLIELIGFCRGRVANVEGWNEYLKDKFIHEWSLGFSTCAHGRPNRVPEELFDDARDAWKLGWATNNASKKQGQS